MFVGVSCGGEWWGLEGFRRVEELGFDGLFSGEHLLFHRPVWDAVSMCTAMACATERIAIGPAATIAPLRHPTLLAKEFTGVDRISNGRLILTLGVGGDNPKEFEAAGVPLERRGRRTQETLEILRRYFSGEPFSYEGEIFQLSDVSLDPLPVRGAATPIWVAGRREPTRRRAALLADGFLPYMITPESFAGMCGSVRELAEAGGRDLPASYAFAAYVYVCLDDDAGARPPPGRRAPRLALLEPRFTGELAGKYAIAGDAAACAEGSAALRRGRAQPISCSSGGAPPGRRSPREALGAVAEGVMPHLRTG